MAKKTQCEQCEKYNPERGLCRKNWNLPVFDNTDCDFGGNDEPRKVVEQETESVTKPYADTISGSESQSDLQPDRRLRHGCATAWLLFMAIMSSLIIIVFLVLLLVSNPNEERLSEGISYIISAGIMLVAVILLYKWNIWGLYIIIGIAILNILVSIFIDGKISGGIGSFAAMIVAFNLQAKDGYTFFDHLGVTNRRKRAQREQTSHYINQIMQKSD